MRDTIGEIKLNVRCETKPGFRLAAFLWALAKTLRAPEAVLRPLRALVASRFEVFVGLLLLSLLPLAAFACAPVRSHYSAPFKVEPRSMTGWKACDEIPSWETATCCYCRDSWQERGLRHSLGLGSGECMQTACGVVSPKESSR